MLDWRHVKGLALRYAYLYRRSMARIFEIVFWPVMDLLVWGFLTSYLVNEGGGHQANFLTFLLGAMIFWDILYRAQQGVTLPFLEDIWGRSLLNVFIAPVRLSEVLAATYLVGFVKILFTAGILSLLALGLYSYNLYDLGIAMVPLFANLLLTGWAVGMVTTALILRWGQAAEALAWGVPFLFQPFSAVFYPVSALPTWLQPVALGLPSTHVFEGMRQVMREGHLSGDHLAWALGLNVVYLALGGWFFAHMVEEARRRGLLAQLGTQ